MECYLAIKEGNPAICCDMDWTLAVLCKVKQAKVKLLSCVRLFATPGTIACQAPLSMRFSKQEYWRGLPCPPPGDIPEPGIEPAFPVLQEDSLSLSHLGRPMKDVHTLNTNTMSFYIRKLNILGVCYLQGILEPAPCR